MTYSTLLSAIYAAYDRLWEEWTSEMERAGDAGVFIFLPEGYTEAGSFREVSYTYWTIERVRVLLKEGGQTHAGLDALVEDISVADEFLVMIVEDVGDAHARAVHVHRIGKFGFN